MKENELNEEQLQAEFEKSLRYDDVAVLSTGKLEDNRWVKYMDLMMTQKIESRIQQKKYKSDIRQTQSSLKIEKDIKRNSEI